MKKLVLVCLLTFSAIAWANTIELAYTYVDAGGQQDLVLGGTSVKGANGLQRMNTQNPTGILANLIPAPNAWVLCYELGQHTDFPYNTYNVAPLASVMDSGKAALISQLWAQHYKPAWQSNTAIYYGGSYGGFVSGQPANTLENQEALAMNFAIYDIFYDFNGSLSSLSLSSGTFKVNSANPTQAINTAAAWLGSLVLPQNYGGPTAQLLGLTNGNLQNLIVEIPEPATISILTIGMLLAFRKRK